MCVVDELLSTLSVIQLISFRSMELVKKEGIVVRVPFERIRDDIMTTGSTREVAELECCVELCYPLSFNKNVENPNETRFGSWE